MNLFKIIICCIRGKHDWSPWIPFKSIEDLYTSRSCQCCGYVEMREL
jgi:hypothetical protein